MPTIGYCICLVLVVYSCAVYAISESDEAETEGYEYTPRHLTNDQASFFQSYLETPFSHDTAALTRRIGRVYGKATGEAMVADNSESSWLGSDSESRSANDDDDEEDNEDRDDDDDGGEDDDDDDDDDDAESSSNEYYDDSKDGEKGNGSDSVSLEMVPRLLSQSAFHRISETLGALNTVGHLLVDMTRGGQDHKSDETTIASTGAVSSTAASSTAATTTAEDAPQKPSDPPSTAKILGPLPTNAGKTEVASVGAQNATSAPLLIKRIGQDEVVSKPMFVENKETKKKKKKKNKKGNKVKKPISEVPVIDGTETKVPTTLRPPTGLLSSSTTAKAILADQLALASEDSTAKDAENRCKTPNGRPGRCEDLSSCPALLLNLSSLRESLCFKSLFVPGVCCPIQENATTVLTTQRPLKLTTKPPVTLATTRRPPSLVLIPQLKPSTTTTTTTTTTPATSLTGTIGGDLDLLGGGGGSSGSSGSNSVIDADECGQQEYSTGRIVGGIEAPNGQWPWMAAIFLHGPKRTEFWCGGSLIGSKYILTAAHCTRDSRQKPFAARQFTVRLGDIDLSTDSEPSAPVTFAVKEVRAHERFSRIGFYNDIAILVLDRAVRKSKYVIPLCLPKGLRMPPQERLPGRRATVVGWGTTYYGGKESTTQRQAELPIWRNEDCDRSYFQPINENFICAGYSDGGVDACQGDSGGPLMMRYDTRWIQLGVVSFGNKCGEPGYPGVYTRVTQYLDWIETHTRD